MLTVGSLFAGIGGFDLGFERAGMRTLWQVEQNEFCRRVLKRHFPNSQRFNDVREVTGCVRRWEEHGGTLLEYVDVLCGGFPCQDLSYAGKGAGLEGERSGLWSEYARLIGELRPRYVVVENVSALLGRGLGRVLGDLAEVGYDAEWDCIPASAVGAPHRRDRVWLVAYAGGERYEPDTRSASRSTGATGPREQSGGQFGGRCTDVADAQGKCEELRAAEGERSRGSSSGSATALADTDSERRARGRGPRDGWDGLADGSHESRDRAQDEGRSLDNAGSRRHGAQAREVRAGRDRAFNPGGWPAEPEVGRVVDGFPGRVDELRALGNALVPQIAEWIGQRIIEAEGGMK